VILNRGKAKEALEWTRAVLERLGLTLNEEKTSIRNARRERFDFPGYTFGPHYSARTGHEFMGRSPSKKSVSRIKEKQGTRRFSLRRIFGELGVSRLRGPLRADRS
jgi:RNA-directed DNA polymerase